MDCLKLYGEIKAEGQVQNFFHSYKTLLSEDVYELADIRQTILMCLIEFLNKTKLDYNKDKIQFLKTANVVVQNQLNKILRRVAREELKQIPDFDRLEESNIIQKGTLEYNVAYLRLVKEYPIRKIAKELNLKKTNIDTILRNIYVTSEQISYVNKSIRLSDYFKDDGESEEMQDLGLFLEPKENEINEDISWIWNKAEVFLDKKSYKILQLWIIDKKNSVEIGKILNVSPQGVRKNYQESLKKLRKNFKKVVSF